VIGLAVATELRFELEILIIYKSSTHRKKLAVKHVPVIGLAYATELQILRVEIWMYTTSKHLTAL
jgi:hypothetical protein